MKIALGQMCSADSHGPNIATLKDYAARAAREGAELLCLPEVAGLMNANFKVAQTQVVDAADDPYLAAAAEAAAEHGLWLHAGSTPVRGPEEKFLNHSVLFGPDGRMVAEYDKIHLFDIQLDDGKPTGESKRFSPGGRGVVVNTPLGKLGLTICYDVRFPQLYRACAQAGAEILFVPSAFTVPTGRAHWQTLLTSRAIENGAFVVAPAQVGKHADGRETWGQSLVIGPWGDVRLDLGRDGPTLGWIEIDLSDVARARRQIPSLTHDREFEVDIVETST
ncbi:carbon-nitrogen hydrolase family protein [Rhodobacterales bacterium HKCCE3408]|nr:carbon-nitrogen hydrolase family protein [Rhodobacterales bacterium HKCCE3408]